MPVDGLAWIDSHAHVFDESCIFSKESRYTPKRPVPPDTYLELLDKHGIGGAVLVQPSFLGTDNSCLTGTIARRRTSMRGVAVVTADVTPGTLSTLRAEGIRGVRLNLIGLPDPDFTNPAWRQWLQHVAAANLPVDLHASGDRWATLLPPLQDQGITVVIEHFGRPGSVDSAGFKAILAAAARGRAWVKVSAPYRMSTEVLHEALPLLLTHFGPERLVWGSDFPWTQHEEGRSMAGCMADCVAWMTQYGLSHDQRQAVAGGNARILYDLPQNTSF